mmetsp:Transcript_94343/g.147435  ORF Transcript_94343/g.147435 Transcript_94343/m.147435 type:complete len:239 (+) Transcript_94343:715-1431(+)
MLPFKTSPSALRGDALDGEHGVATGLSFLRSTVGDALTLCSSCLCKESGLSVSRVVVSTGSLALASVLHCCTLLSFRAESGRTLGEDARLLLRCGGTGCLCGAPVTWRFRGDGGRGRWHCGGSRSVVARDETAFERATKGPLPASGFGALCDLEDNGGFSALGLRRSSELSALGLLRSATTAAAEPAAGLLEERTDFAQGLSSNPISRGLQANETTAGLSSTPTAITHKGEKIRSHAT